MYFDPSAPEAARWRYWLTTALGDRGVPGNATIEIQIRPLCEAAVARLSIDLCWAIQDRQRRTRAEVFIPNRRLLGEGWPGWPAYQAGVALLRSLD